jgi:2,4-dienoyl-CoA reductase-like NADH-dependent reductase (Old Yellow Enzyme family)
MTMHLDNRLVMPPMATAKALPEGHVSPDLLEYYSKRSDGGYIGLIIIEHSYVSLGGRANDRQLSVADDSTIEGLQKLAEAIHGHGSKTVMQINHAGSAGTTEIDGTTPVAPSAINNPLHLKGSSPRELGTDEIKGVVEAFVRAASRVKAAGFDGVEVHSAHGYLLNQFLSPMTNRRHDTYGGELINRIRIHLEIIDAIRSALGPDYPIFLRLGASDYREGGTTLEDSVIAARAFEAAGLAALDVSGGFNGFSIPGVDEQGYFAPLTGALKQAIGIPVMLTGGIKDALVADQLLQDNKADLIGVGRAMLSDRLWAKKAIEALSSQ